MKKNNHIASYDVTATAQWCMLGMMAAVFLIPMMSDAYAGGAAAGFTICNYVAQTMGSGLARAIATIGVLIVGVGATLGRMSWTMALTVAIGIAFMFTAGQVVQALANGQTGCWGN